LYTTGRLRTDEGKNNALLGEISPIDLAGLKRGEEEFRD
jgi:hypothetical protein